MCHDGSVVPFGRRKGLAFIPSSGCLVLHFTRIHCLHHCLSIFLNSGGVLCLRADREREASWDVSLGHTFACVLPRRIFETFAYSSHLSLHNHLRLHSLYPWLRHLRRRSAAVLTRLLKVGQVASAEATAASPAWDSSWEAGA